MGVTGYNFKGNTAGKKVHMRDVHIAHGADGANGVGGADDVCKCGSRLRSIMRMCQNKGTPQPPPTKKNKMHGVVSVEASFYHPKQGTDQKGNPLD